MATEKPKPPPGIKKFAAMLGVVASAPKEVVESREAALKKARKKRRGKQ